MGQLYGCPMGHDVWGVQCSGDGAHTDGMDRRDPIDADASVVEDADHRGELGVDP